MLNKSFLQLICELWLLLKKPVVQKIALADDNDDPLLPLPNNPKINPAIKLIAFYLPQYHPFNENDTWWGKGFTEWTNVGKAKPNFEEHYQPHCPIHLGYYDLRLVDNMIEQANLARSFGIHGFCYYYYWFNGKTLMELPLTNMLNDKRVDIPFFLMWANENWSRRWDGLENDVLIAQNHSTEDSIAFINNLAKYFLDDRYIKVDGKPVLGVYRPDLIPHMKETAEIWRNEVKKMGFPGLYIINSQSFKNKSPEPYNFDAAVQFPPFPFDFEKQNEKLNIINKYFTGPIFKYKDLVHHYLKENSKPNKYKLFKSTTLSWDNTARKQNSSFIFTNFKISEYKSWLNNCAVNCLNNQQLSPNEKFIFINAWNEWAEGTHLEPDQKFGYKYLQATYDVLKNFTDRELINNSKPINQTSDTAIIIHAHYEEELRIILDKIKTGFDSKSFDLFITCTSLSLVKVARSIYPNSNVYLVENRGRDILPFIEILKLIIPLNYKFSCKLHTKRSSYRNDGSILFENLTNPLIGSTEAIQSNIDTLHNNPGIGMISPSRHLIKSTLNNSIANYSNIKKLELITETQHQYSKFVAGSMFWFKPFIFEKLLQFDNSLFEVEDGSVDGKIEHALERFFTSLSKDLGMQVVTTEYYSKS
jgi:lipopolysaccharide biosynthesis protein